MRHDKTQCSLRTQKRDQNDPFKKLQVKTRYYNDYQTLPKTPSFGAARRLSEPLADFDIGDIRTGALLP